MKIIIEQVSRSTNRVELNETLPTSQFVLGVDKEVDPRVQKYLTENILPIDSHFNTRPFFYIIINLYVHSRGSWRHSLKLTIPDTTDSSTMIFHVRKITFQFQVFLSCQLYFNFFRLFDFFEIYWSISSKIYNV